MKEENWLVCESCNKRFPLEQKEKAGQHEEICKDIAENLLIKHHIYDNIEKDILFKWIDQQGFDHKNLLEKEHLINKAYKSGRENQGTCIYIAFLRDEIVGISIEEHDIIAIENEPWNKHICTCLAKGKEDFIIIRQKLDENYKGACEDNY